MTQPNITCVSSIQSASAITTLLDPRFLQLTDHLCAKKTTDVPISTVNNNDNEDASIKLMTTILTDTIKNPLKLLSTVTNQITDVSASEKIISSFNETVCVCRSKTEDRAYTTAKPTSLNKNQRRIIFKSHRSLDLSTIHETSFQSDSTIKNQLDYPLLSDNKVQCKSVVKRQPLREFDVNSFDDNERKIDNEKNLSQNSILLILPSDTDQENLPITLKKRSITLPINEPSNKKVKETNAKRSASGQQMITSFFQPIN